MDGGRAEVARIFVVLVRVLLGALVEHVVGIPFPEVVSALGGSEALRDVVVRIADAVGNIGIGLVAPFQHLHPPGFHAAGVRRFEAGFSLVAVGGALSIHILLPVGAGGGAHSIHMPLPVGADGAALAVDLRRADRAGAFAVGLGESVGDSDRTGALGGAVGVNPRRLSPASIRIAVPDKSVVLVFLRPGRKIKIRAENVAAGVDVALQLAIGRNDSSRRVFHPDLAQFLTRRVSGRPPGGGALGRAVHRNGVAGDRDGGDGEDDEDQGEPTGGLCNSARHAAAAVRRQARTGRRQSKPQFGMRRFRPVSFRDDSACFRCSAHSSSHQGKCLIRNYSAYSAKIRQYLHFSGKLWRQKSPNGVNLRQVDPPLRTAIYPNFVCFFFEKQRLFPKKYADILFFKARCEDANLR